MPSSRRQFLLASGVTALAGCLNTTPDYQLVGAVEQKLLRGTRENTNKPVATNRPVAPGPIGDAAPTAVALETVPHETAVHTLTADGSLTVDGGEYDALTAGYDELHWLLDVTLYNDDPVLELSAGSGHAYRGTREQFNDVAPGDRIAATLDQTDERGRLDELTAVASARD